MRLPRAAGRDGPPLKGNHDCRGVRVVAVVGRSQAGKTTLIEHLVGILGRPSRIAVVKHSHHREIDLDVRGKDTWRFTQAGASPVLGVSANRFLLTGRRTLTLAESIRRLRRETPRPEWIFVEGFRDELARAPRIPVVAVVRSPAELEELTRELRNPPVAVLSAARISAPAGTIVCRGPQEVGEVLRQLAGGRRPTRTS